MPETVHLHDGTSFAGRLLAEASSRTPGSGKARWTEIRLYHSTVEGTYVVELLGKSDIPGEHTRLTILVARYPDELPVVLHHPGVGGLTGTARRLLEEAASRDPALEGLV